MALARGQRTEDIQKCRVPMCRLSDCTSAQPFSPMSSPLEEIYDYCYTHHPVLHSRELSHARFKNEPGSPPGNVLRRLL
jgi:hypothetical protein